jgi:Ca-activated chloride channel family protein
MRGEGVFSSAREGENQRNKKRFLRQSCFLWLVLSVLLLTACTSKAKLVQEGNESFADGAYDEAAQAYTEAQQAAPELAEPVYTQANTRYRQEGLAEAEQLLQQALETADATLAQSAYYNLGNVHFNNQNWQAAIDAYQEALRLNPADADARHNLELAMQQMAQQQQEEEQQPQEEEQEEEEQQEEESQENQGEQQQEEQNNGEEQPEQQPTADPNQPEEGQEQQPDPAGEQTPEGESDPSGTPVPIEILTAEQARQLLEAVAQDAQTLQEHLQQIYQVPGTQSGNDW